MTEAKKKKYKRMTVREKEFRKQAKKQLQEKGIIPPDKPRLNRKKFADEVLEEFQNNKEVDIYDIHESLLIMLPQKWDKDKKGNYIGGVSSENVTALKILKMAMELKKIRMKAKDEGRELTAGEAYENVIEPILKL